MPFLIRFLGENVKARQSPATAIGAIVLGDHYERLHIPLCYWNVEQYERQWNLALKCILRRRAVTCLVTAMYNPLEANFIVIWPMYNLGDVIALQNRILFRDGSKPPVDEVDIDASVPERRTINEDGHPISEWVVEISEIEEFMRTQGPYENLK